MEKARLAAAISVRLLVMTYPTTSVASEKYRLLQFQVVKLSGAVDASAQPRLQDSSHSTQVRRSMSSIALASAHTFRLLRPPYRGRRFPPQSLAHWSHREVLLSGSRLIRR